MPRFSLNLRPWRLRTKLIVALALVFLPILLLVSLSHLQDLEDRRASRAESLSSIDKTVAASLDGFAQDLETLSESAAITLGLAAEAGVPLNQDNFGSYFATLATTYGARSIFITDLDGRVIAGSQGNVGFDVSQRPYLVGLREGADTVWSGALAGQLSGQTTLAYGRRVLSSDGRTLAYLMVAFYPPRIQERIPPELPQDTNVTLIDNNGVVLINSANPPETPTFDISNTPFYERVRSTPSIQVKNETTPFDEGERYGAFERVERTGWIVGISRPSSAIDGPLEARFQRDLAILTMVLLAGLAVMMFIASRLSRPVSLLAASAEALERGESPRLDSLDLDPDFQRLQHSMQRMGRAIRDRETVLIEEKQNAERLANQLNRLHASRNALSTLAPPEDICRIVLSEAVKALGASRGAILLTDENGDELTTVATFGDQSSPTQQTNTAIQLSLGRNGQAPLNGPLFLEDARTQIDQYLDPTSRGSLAGAAAAALVPLVAESQTLGMLVLLSDAPRDFPEDEQDLAKAFAAQAAQSLHRAQLYEGEQEARRRLEVANSTLAHSNQAKDEFLGIIAHELRTPLTTVYGSARLLNNKTIEIGADETSDLINGIELEAAKMSQLVENLLLLARSELGRQPTLVPIDIPEVVHQAIADFSRMFPSRHVDVEVHLTSEILDSDETSVRQVVFNLLTNSAKYSPLDKPIEITIEDAPGAISLTVRDHGPGVNAEELPLIFESFYRSAGAKSAPGKGIGLAVCRRLVESLGGSISARQCEPTGLAVSFALPKTNPDLEKG
jgi:signal transduction histidine kinase